MFQVPLGQPEVVLSSIPLEPNKELWLFVGSQADWSVCYDVFHLFLTIHQLWWLGLVSGPYLGRVGVVRLQALHILKLGESG